MHEPLDKDEVISNLRAELVAMDARLAEALKDVRRYRWLRERVDWKPQPQDASGKVYLVATMVSAVYGDTNDQTDEAIDEAMHNAELLAMDAEVDRLRNILDLLRTDRNGEKYHFAISRGGSLVRIDSAIDAMHNSAREVAKSAPVDQIRYDNLHISALILSTSTVNKLISGGVVYVSDLCGKSAIDLLKMDRFGKKSLDQIERALAINGMRLRNWDEPEYKVTP